MSTVGQGPMLPDGEFESFGTMLGTEILRYRHANGLLSSTFFRYEGGIMTARHVAQGNGLQDFCCGEGYHEDIAYRPDRDSHGLRLGFLESYGFDNVGLIASDILMPQILELIRGSVDMYFSPTPLSPFYPHSEETACPYFKKGLSGSPLIYEGHIIGVVPFGVRPIKKGVNPHELAVYAFNMGKNKRTLEYMGLTLEDIEIRRGTWRED